MNSPNSPTAAADSRVWRVYHRPRKGRGIRWREVGAGLTHREAVGLIVAGERGEYWLTDRGETAAGEEGSESSES